MGKRPPGFEGRFLAFRGTFLREEDPGMSDRTAMFLGAVVFVVAVYYAQAFLVESWAHTHPDSTWAHAALNLKNGTGGE